MTAWIVVLVVGAGSYFLRALLFAVVTKPLPARLETGLSLAGPAAIAALLATMSFTSGGRVQPLPAAELVALAAGFVAVRRSGNPLHAFVVGLPLLGAAQAIGL